MSAIRPATAADLPAILAMGERFHAEAGWGDIVDFVPADCLGTLQHLLDNPGGILLVMESAGEVVGMAGGLAHPFYFNHAHRTGQELFFYVAPNARQGLGSALLNALEDSAREIGCTSWAMIAVDRLRPAAIGRLYERRGYRAAEHSYIKRL